MVYIITRVVLFVKYVCTRLIYQLFSRFLELAEGEMTYHQLIEQYKRTPPNHYEFRDSLLCILKILKIQANSVPPGGK